LLQSLPTGRSAICRPSAYLGSDPQTVRGYLARARAHFRRHSSAALGGSQRLLDLLDRIATVDGPGTTLAADQVAGAGGGKMLDRAEHPRQGRAADR
jgi:hypothetical protein